MSITVASVPTMRTTITIEGGESERERLKIVFDDGGVLYFKVEQRSRDAQFVLDIEQTEPGLVDEILLPQKGDSDTDEDGDQFDIFSVITPEQYKQLRVVCVDFENDDRSPQVGEELFAWTGSRFNSSRGGGSIREGHLITEVATAQLDS